MVCSPFGKHDFRRLSIREPPRRGQLPSFSATTMINVGSIGIDDRQVLNCHDCIIIVQARYILGKRPANIPRRRLVASFKPPTPGSEHIRSPPLKEDYSIDHSFVKNTSYNVQILTNKKRAQNASQTVVKLQAAEEPSMSCFFWVGMRFGDVWPRYSRHEVRVSSAEHFPHDADLHGMPVA